jgi:hypothetical protein
LDEEMPMPRFDGEPTLEDVLSDPMVLAVMRRDGVELETLRRVIRDIRCSQRALREQAAVGQRAHHGKAAPL